MIITSWVHWERTLKVAWLWCYVCRKYQHALCTFKDTAYLVPRISLLPFPRRQRVKTRAGLTMLASSRRSVNWGLARKTAGKKWKKCGEYGAFRKRSSKAAISGGSKAWAHPWELGLITALLRRHFFLKNSVFKVFSVYTKTPKPAFSNSPGLKNVFESSIFGPE